MVGRPEFSKLTSEVYEMSWLFDNFELVARLAGNHVALSIAPIILGFSIALPLGWIANRWLSFRSWIIAGGSFLYTIPSLPLFVILPFILGTRITDERNIIVALTIYAVAILIRTAADAFAAVPTSAIEASRAIGYSSWNRFWKVEFPLAGPVLLAGLRVVSASTIALVSVGPSLDRPISGISLPMASSETSLLRSSSVLGQASSLPLFSTLSSFLWVEC